jgi:hypothetical protein
MKKLLAIAGFAALTMAANTGCDVDADIDGNGQRMVIDDIVVDRNGWEVALTDNGDFDYYYYDIERPEITERFFNRHVYTTYWRYGEERGGRIVDVQEPLPAVITRERFEDGYLIPYTETLSCSYEVGYMRIMLSRSDYFDLRPDQDLYFRLVIEY